MMQRGKHWRGVVIGVLLLAMVVGRGVSCSFENDTIFFATDVPENLPQFLAGKLDVVQPGYLKKDLAVAYRVLSDKPLNAKERAEAAKPDLTVADSYYCCGEAQPEGVRLFESMLPPVAGDLNQPGSRDLSKRVPGQDWENFDNCLDSAFMTAAKTLQARRAAHPTDQAALADWLNGQLAVFSNCNGKSGKMPEAAPSGSPAWLIQDRDYQIAAAEFYRGEFEAARTDFSKVAADHASPWHDVAPYLIGRSWLRDATLTPEPKLPDSPPQPDVVKAAYAKRKSEMTAKFRQAAVVFEPIASGKGPYATDAQQLLDLAKVHIDRAAYTARIANEFAQDKEGLDTWQTLQDMQYFWRTLFNDGGVDGLEVQANADRQSDLMDWVDTMRAETRGPGNPVEAAAAHALERWQATKNTPWLVAAITLAKHNDDTLTAAAKQVPPNSPAWMSVTYHRLRLAPDHAAAHAEIASFVKKFRANKETLSTVNLFLSLQAMKSSSLQDFLAASPRTVLFEGDPTDRLDSNPETTTPASPATAPTISFDGDTTEVLNYKLPVATMVEGAESGKLPEPLHGELAQAAWTRAVLLNRPDLAKRMTPTLLSLHPAWKKWITTYDDAQTEDERKITGIIALMNASRVSPDVPEPNFNPYQYQGTRVPWGCGDPRPNPNPDQKATAAQSPPFVTTQMLSQASAEAASLNRVSPGSDYFARESLAWIKVHPNDPRNEELTVLGFRALHDTCRYIESETPQEKELSHELFNLLHRKYPNSVWAKKYRVWP